jgi:hypothetical protein
VNVTGDISRAIFYLAETGNSGKFIGDMLLLFKNVNGFYNANCDYIRKYEYKRLVHLLMNKYIYMSVRSDTYFTC